MMLFEYISDVKSLLSRSSRKVLIKFLETFLKPIEERSK